MQVPRNDLKAKLQSGVTQYGLWLNTASPVVAEMAGHTGFDWCLIDGEHGPVTLSEMVTQLQALSATPTQAVVRIPEPAVWMIKQVLDQGVQTVVVPMVDNGEIANKMGQAMRYPPHGVRGIGAGMARASRFGQMANYMAEVDEQVCLLVQAESASALANIDEIAGATGVDGVFIGPADLSASMGYPGNPDHPEVLAAIDHMIARIKTAGKIAGIFTTTPEQSRAFAAQGVTFIGVGADVVIYRRALEAAINCVRS